MPTIFDNITITKPSRSVFDLSHENKLSCNQGELIPVYVQEVLPGDSFKVNSEVFLRFAPLTAPVMHRVDVSVHYFFVPNRLIWDKWEEFITNGAAGAGDVVPPQFMYTLQGNENKLYNGSLADYMGLPCVAKGKAAGTASNQVINVSELPFRAYNLIWNEYYRDQNLQTAVDIDKDSSGVRPLDSSIISNLLTLRNRCWEKDYFTSALPWTQRGNPVKIPIAGSAPVVNNYSTTPAMATRATSPATLPAAGNLQLGATAGTQFKQLVDSAGNGVQLVPNGTLKADLTNASSTTVNDLRTAFQLQRWLEKNARAGARYIENIAAHFGVISSDSRLQRPEYLGGGKAPVVISEVLQTSSSDMTTPQGNMAGHAYSVQNTNSFARKFEEHGFVMGIMSVMPRTCYQENVPRMFSRSKNTDYYWPEFAHLGEQAILGKELFYNPNSVTPEADTTFGYQSRYAEYRYKPSEVHGDFKTTLSFWHMGRIFLGSPALNSSFVTADPTFRCFAVQDPAVNHLWVQVYNKVTAIRPSHRWEILV